MIIIPFYLGHVLLLLVADLANLDLLDLLRVASLAGGADLLDRLLLWLLIGSNFCVIENNSGLLLLNKSKTTWSTWSTWSAGQILVQGTL